MLLATGAAVADVRGAGCTSLRTPVMCIACDPDGAFAGHLLGRLGRQCCGCHERHDCCHDDLLRHEFSSACSAWGPGIDPLHSEHNAIRCICNAAQFPSSGGLGVRADVTLDGTVYPPRLPGHEARRARAAAGLVTAPTLARAFPAGWLRCRWCRSERLHLAWADLPACPSPSREGRRAGRRAVPG
jgi:hypothetical protein